MVALLLKWQSIHLPTLSSRIVRRIDKDTSAFLVVAKHNAAHQALAEQLLNHDMPFLYGTVHGQARAPQGTTALRTRSLAPPTLDSGERGCGMPNSIPSHGNFENATY